MAKAALSFRFSEDFAELLRTWAFVTGTEQRELLETAFREYAARNSETAQKVNGILGILESPQNK